MNRRDPLYGPLYDSYFGDDASFWHLITVVVFFIAVMIYLFVSHP